MASNVSKELLNVLACPKCKSGLKHDSAKKRLLCKKCSVFYEIKHGIPLALEDKAKKIP